MSLASRTFNRKQSLDREVKDVYGKITFGTPSAPTASLATTAPVVVTHALGGSYLNGRTITLVVNAAAANPTNTVLAAVTGTASAIIVTITPNDGTNNTATPVNLTTAHLATLLGTGAFTGVTVTDTGSLLAQFASASGGNTTALAHGGEGDGLVATFGGGADNVTNSSVVGIASVARNGIGDYTITLQDAYYALKNFKTIRVKSAAQDLRRQIYAQDVSGAKTVRFLTLTGAVATDPSSGTVMLVKFELKNSSAS